MKRHRHSPRVRRLASEAGISLASLSGTGPAGRVTTADVSRAVRGAGPEGWPATGPATAVCVAEVDITAVEKLRAEQIRLPALIAKATVEALRQIGSPLGLAVESEPGSTVVLVPDAAALSLVGLARRLDELGNAAPGDHEARPELPTRSVVVRNTRPSDVLWDTPVLPSGQAAILAAGTVVERAVVVRRPDGEAAIAIRSMAHLALTHDQRLLDGQTAARLITSIKHRLEAGRFDNQPA